jgi:hypothetical protein
MPFVPMVPPQRPASARAQDLGRRLKAEVEKFEAQYPGTSPEDIRAAAELAISSASRVRQGSRAVRRVIAGLAAAQIALGTMFATAAARGDSTRVLFPMFIALMMGGTLLIIAIALRYSRRSG